MNWLPFVCQCWCTSSLLSLFLSLCLSLSHTLSIIHTAHSRSRPKSHRCIHPFALPPHGSNTLLLAGTGMFCDKSRTLNEIIFCILWCRVMRAWSRNNRIYPKQRLQTQHCNIATAQSGGQGGNYLATAQQFVAGFVCASRKGTANKKGVFFLLRGFSLQETNDRDCVWYACLGLHFWLAVCVCVCEEQFTRCVVI